jgi:hypothetical protein
VAATSLMRPAVVHASTIRFSAEAEGGMGLSQVADSRAVMILGSALGRVVAGRTMKRWVCPRD